VTPAQKKVLFGAIAAVLTALAAYFSSAGCSPAQIQKAESKVDAELAKAACVKRVAERFDDLLSDPESIRLDDLLQFRKELEGCVKPAAPSAPDAGA
jgi:hypothetical protein